MANGKAVTPAEKLHNIEIVQGDSSIVQFVVDTNIVAGLSKSTPVTDKQGRPIYTKDADGKFVQQVKGGNPQIAFHDEMFGTFARKADGKMFYFQMRVMPVKE